MIGLQARVELAKTRVYEVIKGMDEASFTTWTRP